MHILGQKEKYNNKLSHEGNVMLSTSVSCNFFSILTKEIKKIKYPITISVGQSILFAIDVINHCSDEAKDEILKELKKIYMQGVTTENELLLIDQIDKIMLINNYIVSRKPEIIDNDPSRRYFETHFAYHFLHKNCGLLDNAFLKKLRIQLTSSLEEDLVKRVKNNEKRNEFILQLNNIIEGVESPYLDKYKQEYIELIRQLMNGDYHGLSKSQCDNLLEIARSSILAALITEYNENVPMDIYSGGIFEMGVTGRGRLIKINNDLVKTSLKGIMKSTTPAPLHDDPARRQSISKAVMGRKVSCEITSTFQRSADQATSITQSVWVAESYAKLVHPYSNGISSTTLAQLRALLLEWRKNHSYFLNIEEFILYFLNFASLMVYNSGGHTFNEIFQVLLLPEIRRLLTKEEQGWLHNLTYDDIITKWILETEGDILDQSIKETIIYNNHIMSKYALNVELKAQEKFKNNNRYFHCNEPNNNFLLNNEYDNDLFLMTNAIMSSDIERLTKICSVNGGGDILLKMKAEYGQYLIDIASLFGDDGCLRVLIASGAKFSDVQYKNPYIIPIRYGHFTTVETLLKMKKDPTDETVTSDGRWWSPMLEAANQGYFDIIKLLWISGKFSKNDLKDAMLLAVKKENTELLEDIITLCPQLKNIIKENFGEQMILESAKIGSYVMIDKLIKMGVRPRGVLEAMKISCINGFYKNTLFLLNKIEVSGERRLIEKAVNNKNFFSSEMIAYAVQHNQPEIVLLLLSYGSDFSRIDIFDKHEIILWLENEVFSCDNKMKFTVLDSLKLEKINENIRVKINHMKAYEDRQPFSLKGYIFLSRLFFKKNYSEELELWEKLIAIIDKVTADKNSQVLEKFTDDSKDIVHVTPEEPLKNCVKRNFHFQEKSLVTKFFRRVIAEDERGSNNQQRSEGVQCKPGF